MTPGPGPLARWAYAATAAGLFAGFAVCTIRGQYLAGFAFLGWYVTTGAGWQLGKYAAKAEQAADWWSAHCARLELQLRDAELALADARLLPGDEEEDGDAR